MPDMSKQFGAWGGRTFAASGAKRRRPGSGSVLRINLVPMIDIVFNLLVFFLVTTKFTPAEGVLAGRLPEVKTSQAVLSVPTVPIRIRLVPHDGTGCLITIEDRSVRPADFDQLAEVLRQIQTEPGYDDQTPVVLLADSELVWDHVVNAYNAAVRTKYKNIVFGAD